MSFNGIISSRLVLGHALSGGILTYIRKGVSGVLNVPTIGQSLTGELETAYSAAGRIAFVTEAEKYWSTVNFSNQSQGGRAMCENAAGANGFYINADNSPGTAMTAWEAAIDTNFGDGDAVNAVIFQQGNQDAAFIGSTITAEDYEDAFNVCLDRIHAKCPNATIYLWTLTRRTTDVNEDGWQAIREIQDAAIEDRAYVKYILSAHDLVLRDSQHFDEASQVTIGTQLARRIAADMGKASAYPIPEMQDGTYTGNILTVPLSQSGLLPSTDFERVQVYDGGSEITVSQAIVGSDLILTRDFAEGNIPDGSTIVNCRGQMLALTDGAIGETPSKLVKNTAGLPLRPSTVNSSQSGTLKQVVSTCLLDTSAAIPGSYPGSGTVLRDLISGKDFNLTNFGFSSDRLTSTGTAYAVDSENVSVPLLDTLCRTDGSNPFAMCIYLTIGELNGVLQNILNNTTFTTGGFALRRETSGAVRFYQRGNTGNQFFAFTTLAATTTVFLAVKGNMSVNQFYYSINGAPWTFQSFTANACTNDADTALRIFANGTSTQPLSSGSALMDFSLFPDLTDQQLADVYAAVLARH